MTENKWWLVKIAVCFAAILYFLLLTQGLPLLIESEFPFGLTDRFGNYKNNAEIFQKIAKFVPDGLDYYDRPVRVLLFRTLYPFFGLNPSGYYFLRAGILALIVLLMVSLLKDKKWIAVFAGLFYLFSPPVYLEAVQLEDVGLVVELLTFLCFYLFLKIYLNEESRKNRITFYSWQMLIVFISLVANRAEGRARIIPLVLLFFILIDNWKKIGRYSFLLAALFLQVLPLGYFFKGSNILQQAVSELPYGIDFSKIYKLFISNPFHNTCFGASLSGVIGILNIWLIAAVILHVFRKKLVKKSPLIFNQSEISRPDKALFCLAAVWLFWTVMTSIVYSYIEPQRLSNSMIPASLLVFLALYYLVNSFKGNYRTAAGAVIFCSVILMGGINLGKTVVLRDKNTSFLAAHHNVNRFIEETEKARDSLVLIFRGGIRKTRANVNTTNIYMPTLTTDPAGISEGMPVDSADYKNIYVISKSNPVRNSEAKGLKYLGSVDGSTVSIYDWAKRILHIPAAHTFYIYKYTGQPLPGTSHEEDKESKIVNPSDFDFSGEYIYVDYEMGLSGVLKLEKIDMDDVQAQILYDENWGEVIKCRGKILRDRIEIEVLKGLVTEIVFRKDGSITGWWKEGQMEQKRGRIFGRLAGDD